MPHATKFYVVRCAKSKALGSTSRLLITRKIRLERLGYFETVEVDTVRVPGQEDQVDLVFKVKEQPSGQISAGIGYGDFAGLSLNASISQDNFLGSGNRVSFGVDTNKYSRNVQLQYIDNYFTRRWCQFRRFHFLSRF